MKTYGSRLGSPVHRRRLIAAGFTVIELLVTVSVVALIAALTIPAVQRSREAARQLRCKNNMRQLAIGMAQFENVHRRFPYGSVTDVADMLQPQTRSNWVVMLLPWLDCKDLYDAFDHKKPISDPSNIGICQTHIPVTACPSDVTTSGSGDLSYALNGGFGSLTFSGRPPSLNCAVRIHQGGVLDLDGDGVFRYPLNDGDRFARDRQLLLATGLFLSASTGLRRDVSVLTPEQYVTRSAFVTDGLSNTMLLSENLMTGTDSGDPFAGWASGDAARVFVAINPEVCWAGTCSKGMVDLRLANSHGGGINAGRSGVEGQSPYPSSYHRGGVNVAFADGSVSFISESIEGDVYFGLFTPQSSRLVGTPFAQ